MIRISKSAMNELVQYIDTEYSQTKGDWRTWLENTGKWYRIYDNDLDNKTEPWPGCSNLNVPITSIAVERMHSSLLGLVADPQRIVKAVPTESSDIRSAAAVEMFANWQLSTKMRFPEKYDLTAHRTCIIGQVGCVVFWSDRSRMARVRHRVRKDILPSNRPQDVAEYHYGESLLSAEARDSFIADLEFTERGRNRDAVIEVLQDVDRIDPRDDEIEYEVRSWLQIEYGPVVEPTMPEDLLYTLDSTLPEEASIHFHSRWLRLAEIEDNVRRGEYHLSKKVMKSLRQDQEREASSSTIENTEGLRSAMEAAAPIRTQGSIRRHRFHVQKTFLAYDLDKDGFPEELIVTLLYDKTREPHLARIDYLDSVVPTGVRPVAFSQFIPYDVAAASKGIPEVLRPVQAEMNTIHNQRIDRNSIITLPFFMFGRGAQLATQLYKLRPGEGVPVGDVNQVKMPVFPQQTGADFQSEMQLQGMAEKMVPSSDLQLGRATPGRQTAYEVGSLLQQGSEQFGKFIGRQARFISRVSSLAVGLSGHFMDPEIEFRVTGSKEVTRIRREDVLGYDFNVRSTAAVVNAGQGAQQVMFLFQMLTQSPLVNQSEGRLWWLHKALLEALQRPDVEQLIGPEPEESMHPPMNADKEHVLFNEGIYRDARIDDDHESHMAQHQQRIIDARQAGNWQEVDLLLRHIESHKRLFNQAQQAAFQQQGGDLSTRQVTPEGGGTNNFLNSLAATQDQQLIEAGTAGGL